MKKELQEELVKKYPNLYKMVGDDPKTTCMTWGFECGDGWFKLLDELSAKLEPLGIVALQVKEKFGGLRFYFGGCNSNIYDEVYRFIGEAENKSVETCEKCGEPGKQRSGGWIRTLCDNCVQ